MYKQIEVIPYDINWSFIFEEETKKIQDALQNNYIDIYHIGSTSVPGLASKPIIDIICVVKDLKSTIPSLERIGFKYKGEYNIPMRLYFSMTSIMKVNLHVYEEDHAEIELNLFFRNYLRDHPKEKEEYAKLKERLLQNPSSYEKHNSLFTGYNLGKDAFIHEILKKSGFNRIRLMKCVHYNEWDTYHRIREEQIFRQSNIKYDRNHSSIHAAHHFHFVLYHGVQIVSTAHIEFLNEDEAAFRTIATDEEYKNQGFGKAIVQLLEKWCKFSEKRWIKTHARLSAESFYRKLGYSEMHFDDPSILSNYINLGKKLC